MRWLRIVLFVLLVASLAPAISLFAAAGIAGAYGCRLHEGFANPCVVFGRDIGETLYGMAVSGWLMMLTLPTTVMVVVGWLVLELVVFFRRRRAAGRRL